MELLKLALVCVFISLMSRESISQNIDRNEAIHHTIKDQDKHMQKREHQGLIPQILKLGQPFILSKPISQRIPQTVQEARTQMIPRQTLHEIPQALQQSSQAILQRPINLRLNTASNLQRRVTNETKYPVHKNNSIPSLIPISHPEVPKDLDVKVVPLKQDTVLTPVPNNPVVHILIPKETPDSDKNHKPAEFFEDDEKDSTPTYHPKYLNKIAGNDRRLNDHETKDQNLDDIVEIKKANKIYLNNAEIKVTNDHNDTKYDSDSDSVTNKIRDQKISKFNAMDDEQGGIHNETQFSRETSKGDAVTMKETIHKQPVPKTTNRTDKNKIQNSLLHSLTKNTYTGDNIISIKARKGENRKINEKSTSTPQIQNDKSDNVLIHNHTYEEIYERSINSNPSVLYNKRFSNIQTPDYSTYSDKNQDIYGEYNSPVYVYAEDYSNLHPSTTNIKYKYNKYTNSYENDPNLFFKKENKPSVEDNENQINSNIYDKPTNLDLADYYPKGPYNFIDRIWRTWRNSDVQINNNVYKRNNENMDCKFEVPSERIDCNIKEPVNAVIPITNGNVIGVNGCYKNQNKPVTCRYCPSYQCYY